MPAPWRSSRKCQIVVTIANNWRANMKPSFSVYLDLVRFGSAIVVFMGHIWVLLVPGWHQIWPGHHAVVVFFVLSGVVIAYVTDGRETTLREYSIRRVARVWSVAIPALLLAAAVSPFVGPAVDGINASYDSIFEILVANLANVFFVGQLWTLTIFPALNAPIWSLNYEVWYYVIFGAWYYMRGPARVPVVLLLAAIAGPNILLMMPCWLAGVWVYRHPFRVRPPIALMLTVGSITGYLFLLRYNIPVQIREWCFLMSPGGMVYLHGASTFIGDYMIAICVAANFVGIRALDGYLAFLVALRRPIAFAASFTFSIYLFNLALLAVFRFALELSPMASLLATIAGILVLGHLTEHKLPWVRALIRRLFARMIGPDGCERS
jgi:peptidoglycan/LPS O-acetylase OafA/YrhL